LAQFHNILYEKYCNLSLQKYEKVYNEQLNAGCVSKSCQFEYGFCLVRSSYPVDVKKGIRLMEELCRQYPEDKRDCMYFLALGYARVKVRTLMGNE